VNRRKPRALAAPLQPGVALARLVVMMVIGLAAALSLGATVSARTVPGSFADLVEKLAPSVVNISTEGFVEGRRRRALPPGFEQFEEFFNRRLPGQDDDEDDSEERRVRSLGSGFIIQSSGLIVTNNHVIEGAENIQVTLDNGIEYRAEVIGADEDTDLALLQINADVDLPTVSFGDSDVMRVGDWVLAIGSPFDLGGTVTAGILSAKGRTVSGGRQLGQYFQTDAPINRGNSGGPMFNMDGEVIGVNTAIFSPTGGSVGIGFAIPSNFAQKVLADLKEFGRFRRGWLGVVIQPADPLTGEALGIDIKGGAQIGQIMPDSPAAQAGLQTGDIIVQFDGEEILNSAELAQSAATAGVGRTVDVVFYRGDQKKQLKLTLGEFPAADDSGELEADAEEQAEPSLTSSEEILGMEIAPLTATLRDRYRLPEDVRGAVVLDVEPRSEAARRDIRAGDVILEVNQEPVEAPITVADEVKLARSRDRNAVLFYLYRNGTYFHVPVPIEVG